jgi:hypothetical protein
VIPSHLLQLYYLPTYLPPHQAVAARLGLSLSFINFPGHVLLRVDGPAADAGTAEFTTEGYLDPASNGRRLSSAAVRPY